MGRYNLLEEPWLSVLDKNENIKNVSLTALFQNAHEYRSLAGDSITQDFSVIRLLLAVLHTVFSRVGVDGLPLPSVEIDENYLTHSRLSEDDEDAYLEALMDTWETLWKQGKFPEVVTDYLQVWKDRFYLFDESYPFFQVTAAEISPENISKAKASSVSGKNINRRISESANKVALFSPKYAAQNNKEILTAPEVARWLFTFQAYTGLSDKVIFGKEKYKASKGWLFDIGGVFIRGQSLFETLLLNCVLVHPEETYRLNVQKPCWEYRPRDIIDRGFSGEQIDNLAELYTNWSRAIYIDPEADLSQPFSFEIVKLPDLNHKDFFLEVMTVWRFNESGENKDTFTPKKHQQNRSLWRSFGLVTLPYTEDNKIRIPGVIQWIRFVKPILEDFPLTLVALSMQDDGNATSWVPTDEIYDELTINDLILADIREAGWIPRINDTVEKTKRVISLTYKNFINDLKIIRNISSSQFVSQRVEELFFQVDQPFKNWVSSIEVDDDKDEKILLWEKELKRIVQLNVQAIIKDASPRDYTGISESGENATEKGDVKNIATAFNKFSYFLNKELG